MQQFGVIVCQFFTQKVFKFKSIGNTFPNDISYDLIENENLINLDNFVS